MSDAPQLLIEALRDRLNRALLRAEQVEAERDKWADAAASWELQAVGNRADAERLAEALKVSEAERDALRARWAAATAFVARDPSWAAQAARMAELEAPDA